MTLKMVFKLYGHLSLQFVLLKTKHINWLFFSTETCDSYCIFALKTQIMLFFKMVSHWKGYRAVCISEEH